MCTWKTGISAQLNGCGTVSVTGHKSMGKYEQLDLLYPKIIKPMQDKFYTYQFKSN